MSFNNKIRVLKLYPDAKLPTRKNPIDAGLDLYAYLPILDSLRGRALRHSYIVNPTDIVIFKTGIAIEVPEGCVGWITNKGGSDYLIGGGIVDEGYKGELLIKVFNPTEDNVVIDHGQAIAQLLVIPIQRPKVKTVSKEEFYNESTDRGTDGGIARQTQDSTGMPHVDGVPHSEYFQCACTDISTGYLIHDIKCPLYDNHYVNIEDIYPYEASDMHYDANREQGKI